MNAMDDIYRHAGGEPLAEAVAAPSGWSAAGSALATLITIVWAILAICAPAIIVATYRVLW